MRCFPIISFVLAILLTPAAGEAQQIRGVVVDDSSDVPIPGVTVELLAVDSTLRATAVAAATGWFQLSPGSAGRFLLRVSHPAYTTSGSLEVVVSNNEIVTVMLRMRGGAIPLAPLVVTARSHDRLSGFRERARHGGLGRYILREDIEKRPAARPSDLLRVAPEVRIEPTRDGGLTSSTILMRSQGDLCVPAIYVDGVPVLQAQDFGFDINDLISTESIEGIEIYGSYVTAPLELHVPRNTCGVIAFWSRTAGARRMTWKPLVLGGLIAGAMLLLAR